MNKVCITKQIKLYPSALSYPKKKLSYITIYINLFKIIAMLEISCKY